MNQLCVYVFLGGGGNKSTHQGVLITRYSSVPYKVCDEPPAPTDISRVAPKSVSLNISLQPRQILYIEPSLEAQYSSSDEATINCK